MREDFLHGRHEFFEEIVVFLAPHRGLAQPKVERIVKQRSLLVPTSSVIGRSLGGTPAQAV